MRLVVSGSEHVRVIRGRLKSVPFLRVDLLVGGRLEYDQETRRGLNRRPVGHPGAVLKYAQGYSNLVE